MQQFSQARRNDETFGCRWNLEYLSPLPLKHAAFRLYNPAEWRKDKRETTREKNVHISQTTTVHVVVIYKIRQDRKTPPRDVHSWEITGLCRLLSQTSPSLLKGLWFRGKNVKREWRRGIICLYLMIKTSVNIRYTIREQKVVKIKTDLIVCLCWTFCRHQSEGVNRRCRRTFLR